MVRERQSSPSCWRHLAQRSASRSGAPCPRKLAFCVRIPHLLSRQEGKHLCLRPDPRGRTCPTRHCSPRRVGFEAGSGATVDIRRNKAAVDISKEFPYDVFRHLPLLFEPVFDLNLLRSKELDSMRIAGAWSTTSGAPHRYVSSLALNCTLRGPSHACSRVAAHSRPSSFRDADKTTADKAPSSERAEPPALSQLSLAVASHEMPSTSWGHQRRHPMLNLLL
jgi:hypothetical protein